VEWNEELLLAGVRAAWRAAFAYAVDRCVGAETLYHLLPSKPRANDEDSVQFKFFRAVSSLLLWHVSESWSLTSPWKEGGGVNH